MKNLSPKFSTIQAIWRTIQRYFESISRVIRDNSRAIREQFETIGAMAPAIPEGLRDNTQKTPPPPQLLNLARLAGKNFARSHYKSNF